jgi:hypothetical protein
MTQKSQIKYTWQRLATCSLLSFLLVFCLAHSRSSAAVFSETFDGTAFIDGSVVSLDKQNPQKLQLASLDNDDYLVGIVQQPMDTLLHVDSSSSEESNSVARTGQARAFVSNQNGEVRKGDLLSASYVPGVAMKSLGSVQQRHIGIALEDFSTIGAQAYEEPEKVNREKGILVNKVLIQLYETESGGTTTEKQLSELEKFASRISGKEVPLVRVFASFVLFLSALIIGGSILVTSIRASLLSIGRNPLASNSIYSVMFRTSGITLMAILIGAGVSYVILIA